MKLQSDLCSLDSMPNVLIKSTLPKSGPNNALINKSLSTRLFPESYKSTMARLLFKKSTLDAELPNNYRQVPNFCFALKVLKKLVVSQLNRYIAGTM